jgi:lipoprotein LprG
MNGLEGFYFIIDRSGAPAFLDPGETISFRRAEGYYVAPDRAQATVRVIAPGLVTDVNIISIGETQWETNLLTATWQKLPPNWGFNPAVLFDPNIGIQSILAADLVDLAVTGNEKLEDGPDGPLYVINGRLDGPRLYEMSYGLIGPETMDVSLWIAPESFELVRAIISDPNGGGESETSLWQVDFRQFGKVVDIAPPEES